jgi:hypothetical protein
MQTPMVDIQTLSWLDYSLAMTPAQTTAWMCFVVLGTTIILLALLLLHSQVLAMSV